MTENEPALEATLLAQIGDDAFQKLVEAFAGTRLYVPRSDTRGVKRGSNAPAWLTNALPRRVSKRQLQRIVGKDAADILARHYAGSYLRVPLAREWRARLYRSQGCSNAQVALKLGMTETGVEKMWKRMDNVPVKGGQLDLFGGVRKA